jgi:hypothetical protein
MRQRQIDPSPQELQSGFDQKSLRRTVPMSMAEKLRSGAALCGECIP